MHPPWALPSYKHCNRQNLSPPPDPKSWIWSSNVSHTLHFTYCWAAIFASSPNLFAISVGDWFGFELVDHLIFSAHVFAFLPFFAFPPNLFAISVGDWFREATHSFSLRHKKTFATFFCTCPPVRHLIRFILHILHFHSFPLQSVWRRGPGPPTHSPPHLHFFLTVFYCN